MYNRRLIAAFLLIQILGTALWVEGAPKKKKMSQAELEKTVSQRAKGMSKKQLNRYRQDAAKKVQNDMVKTLKVLSESNDPIITDKVRSQIKTVIAAAKSGKLSGPLTKKLPMILKPGSSLENKSGEQLAVLTRAIIPNIPSQVGQPLQGLTNFLSANVNGVENILGKTVNGVPDLLKSAVSSLTVSLSGVTDAALGSINSLGPLLGGLLG